MAEKKKIDVIDDEPDLCSLVKENLEETGEFEVMTVTDATRAVQICRNEVPALILLDIVMPKIAGTEILKDLRNSLETKTTPVVVISGLGEIVYTKKKNKWQWLPNRPVVLSRGNIPREHDPEQAAKTYGVEGYIVKPFTIENLLQIIREVLRTAGLRRREASGNE